MRIPQKTLVACVLAATAAMIHGCSRERAIAAPELAVSAHVFARKPSVKSGGRVVPPILAIRFVRFELVDSWLRADDPDRPGLIKGTFRVDIRFDRGDARGLCVR